MIEEKRKTKILSLSSPFFFTQPNEPSREISRREKGFEFFYGGCGGTSLRGCEYARDQEQKGTNISRISLKIVPRCRKKAVAPPLLINNPPPLLSSPFLKKTRNPSLPFSPQYSHRNSNSKTPRKGKKRKRKKKDFLVPFNKKQINALLTISLRNDARKIVAWKRG